MRPGRARRGRRPPDAARGAGARPPRTRARPPGAYRRKPPIRTTSRTRARPPGDGGRRPAARREGGAGREAGRSCARPSGAATGRRHGPPPPRLGEAGGILGGEGGRRPAPWRRPSPPSPRPSRACSPEPLAAVLAVVMLSSLVGALFGFWTNEASKGLPRGPAALRHLRDGGGRPRVPGGVRAPGGVHHRPDHLRVGRRGPPLGPRRAGQQPVRHQVVAELRGVPRGDGEVELGRPARSTAGST